MSANDRQVGGDHYSALGISMQHWDMVNMFDLDYFQGCITKYLFRWRHKGGVDDLRKAVHFLEKYIELENARIATDLHPSLTGSCNCGYVDNKHAPYCPLSGGGAQKEYVEQ